MFEKDCYVLAVYSIDNLPVRKVLRVGQAKNGKSTPPSSLKTLVGGTRNKGNSFGILKTVSEK